MRFALALCFIAANAYGQGCAATPEDAARAAIGAAASGPASGYRVADVQVDPVMKRVWMRVVRCEDASAPAVLVPVSAPLHGSASPVLPVVLSAPVAAPPTVIRAGDAVQAILATSALHMTLNATANQAGGVGDVISLTLKRRPGQPADEPDHRIRGTVRADKTVEVQP